MLTYQSTMVIINFNYPLVYTPLPTLGRLFCCNFQISYGKLHSSQGAVLLQVNMAVKVPSFSKLHGSQGAFWPVAWQSRCILASCMAVKVPSSGKLHDSQCAFL